MIKEPIRFDWDEKKNQSNLIKHGFDFIRASVVFDDPHILVVPDRFVGEEARWHAYGLLDAKIVALVVHTYRYDDGASIIRIISARYASRKERKSYEKALL